MLVDVNQNNQSYFADISAEKLLDSLVWIPPMRTKLGLLGWREEGDWQSRNLVVSRYVPVVVVGSDKQSQTFLTSSIQISNSKSRFEYFLFILDNPQFVMRRPGIYFPS